MKYQKLFFIFVALILMGFASQTLAVVLNNPLGEGSDFATIVGNVTTYIAGLIAGLVVLMFIWSGILFVTSAGNAGRAETAKKVLIYASIGAAVALAGEGLIALLKNVIGA